jgi:hypothetical protein
MQKRVPANRSIDLPDEALSLFQFDVCVILRKNDTRAFVFIYSCFLVLRSSNVILGEVKRILSHLIQIAPYNEFMQCHVS